MSIYEKEAAQAVVQAIKAAGFRAFLAESGTYGFYTDADGSKIIIRRDKAFTAIPKRFVLV